MTKSKNKYTHPVTLNKQVRIAYHDSPAHVGRLKYAVDFIVSIGTSIFAALDGIVVDVKQDSTISGDDESYDKFGNFIEMKHKNKEYSIYEHIKKNGSLVKKGDKIKAGQIIGYSGDTGWVGHLNPHLHFDVHKYFGKGPEEYETVEIVWK